MNVGSSSIKFAAFFRAHKIEKTMTGIIQNLQGEPFLKVRLADGEIKEEKFKKKHNYDYFFQLLLERINEKKEIAAIGHRVVHGGQDYTQPVKITGPILDKLKLLIPFAPLHQPFNLQAIEILQKHFPSLPQIACFDTAFHRTHPRIADLFALPREYSESGVQRYGFHGISYEYIVKQLQSSKNLQPKTIIAHLGNGASLCAVKEGKSYDSTMGFTALDGLVMGTRCGSIDPGVVLYLMKSKNMSYDQIEELLYQQCGLLGVSQISSNMQDLLSSTCPEAREAIDLFVYRARREIGALASSLGGLDTLVFTGGIGENASYVREAICENMEWLGIKINKPQNSAGEQLISEPDAAVKVHVIPTDEELVIAQHTYHLMTKGA